MLRNLMLLLGLGGRGAERKPPADLVTLDRDQIAPFIAERDGFPRIDWGAVDIWIERQGGEDRARAALKRAAAAAWLDRIRDALEADHRRWRHARIEGIGPVKDQCAVVVSKLADSALATIERALKPLRGTAPVPPTAVVALAGKDEYISFISYYYPDEGEWSTSGGMYLNEGDDCFPVVAFPCSVAHSIGETLAHELTHHALRGMDLPPWVEEGFTQMMEERVTGRPNFRLDHEMMRRHRERWDGEAIGRFLSGEAFQSPEDDDQERSYHLSQLVVRGWLSREPERFFAFARACGAHGPDAAAEEHLGAPPAEVVAAALRGAR